MRIGILGCGTIGSYVLNSLMNGNIPGCEVAVVCVRSEGSRGVSKVRSYGIPLVTDIEEMLNYHPQAIIESASHEALQQHGETILRAGIDLIPLSLGALVNAELLETLTDAARDCGSILHIPSGGIGGLDALQAAVNTEVYEVTMTSRKPPVAWKNITYVQSLNLDLDRMTEPTLLYEGSARDCVTKFPQNINIAAALSLAGVGFDRTQIRIMADPTVTLNTHEIHCEGESGRFHMVLENLPVPENPKTTYMACISAIAALKRIRSHYRIGT